MSLLYFTVSLIGILHHELWLDESQHWLLARDSTSLTDLFQNTRLEGHPILWDLMLFFITRFTFNPFWMQFLHIVIATATVFVFLKKAPFNWLFKTLFVFGYFMVFEYNLISRNYMLGILFLFLAVSVYPEKEKKFTSFCLYLAIAINVHIIFSVLVFAMLALTLADFVLDNKKPQNASMVRGLLIFGSSLLLLAVQFFTTNSSWYFNTLPETVFLNKLTPGFISIFKGLLTVPDFTSIHFWERNWFTAFGKSIVIVITILLYLLPLILFYKNKRIVFFVYLALIGIQIFFFVTQRGNIRSYGVVYILFILALWIAKSQCSSEIPIFAERIVFVIVSIQFLSGIVAYGFDLKYPFTSAENVVDYLKQNKLDSQKIATVTSDGAMISPYLERKVYFLDAQKEQSYCVLENGYQKENFTTAKVGRMISRFAEKNDFILVSNFPEVKELVSNPNMLETGISIEKMKSFDKNILENTSFTVYQVKTTQR